jgi:hypothetical protein
MVRIGNGHRRLGFALSVLISGFALLAVVGVAPAAAETCPNEQLREESNLNPFTLQPFSTQLPGYPECRAYELVSPAFKAGLQVQSLVGIAADGSRLVGQSLGTFAGTESNFREAFYEMTRSGAGWQTSAISPPQARFPANEFLAAAADPRRTLWQLRTPGQSIYAQDLYLREADGTFVEVGPMVSPAGSAGPPAGEYQRFFYGNSVRYKGASAGLQHVLFSIRSGNAPVWPGDATTPGLSLYEYSGTGNNRPTLVGISDGATVINGETLPAGAQISDCATSLGAEEEEAAEVYNAISLSGETTFFTPTSHANFQCKEAQRAPEVSELYARIGGSDTVPISEPTFFQCEECNVPATAVLGRASAQFAGASEDGSKAFFLTEQELVSGAAGRNLYEYDFSNPAGKKIIRVSTGSPDPEVQGIARISEDGSHAYFVAAGVLTGPNAAGNSPSPAPGAHNLYVFERDGAHPGGRLSFIGTLSSADEIDWIAADIHPVQATPDGRFLVFQSVSDLIPGDTSTQQQIFEYDALTEELVRVSVGQVGYSEGATNADSHASTIGSPNYLTSFSPAQANLEVALSADGSKVLFSSLGALAPGAEPAASAGATSVYEYRSDGSIADGNVFLISAGVDTPVGGQTGAAAQGVDQSGEDLFFRTADPLLTQDVDTQYDIYDARERGGFPALAKPSACEGDACQGPAPPSSSSPTPSTPHFSGPANPKPSTKCKKGFVKRHGKCVKQQKSKKSKSLKSKGNAKHKRATRRNRGGQK